MSRGPDAAVLLERVLVGDAARCGVAVTLTEVDSTPWASATFCGARHVVMLGFDAGDAGSAWLAGLAEADLPIRGHLVADLAVVRTRRDGNRIEAVVEALTVEER